jgi:D-serine deaminase-like pyridoxal phosphate-dependent protein
LPGHGVILRELAMTAPSHADDNLIVERLSEEHATVRVTSGRTALEPGYRVRLIPNHSCVVSNLVDEAWLTDRDQVLGPTPIAARGKIT